MQQQPVELIGGGVGVVEECFENGRHFPNGELVHLLAHHLDGFVVAALVTGVAHQGAVVFALGNVEAVPAASVTAHLKAQQSVLISGAGFKGQGSCCIAEQHAAAAVIPVHPAAQLIRTDHQHPPHGTGTQKLGCGDQCKQKAAAGRGEIEGDGVLGIQQRLHFGG